MHNPFFSIVIPTHNRSHLVVKTIESVLTQSFSDFEVIVVDDGSTDDTRDKVNSFLDKRVKYIYQTNKERSAARNLGIENALGKYICFLDSDDSFSLEHLEGFHKAIQSNSDNIPRFYFCGVTVWNQKIINIPTFYDFDPEKSSLFFVQGSIIPGQVCVEKSILQHLKFDEEITIAEDTDLWIRISYHYKCQYLEQATINYFLHNQNSINVAFNAYRTRLNGLKRTFSKKEALPIAKNIRRKVLSDCYFGIFRFHINRGEIFKARLMMLIAVLKYPTIRLKEKVYLLIYPKRTN